MFKQYSIKEMFKELKGNYDYELVLTLSNEIKQFINEDVIIRYYPKNLFKDNDSIEYFLLTNNKIIICSARYDNGTNIRYNFKSIPRTQIISAELTSNEYDIAILKIYLAAGEEMTLDNKKDTNEYHSRKFVYLIQEFFKELTLQ